MAEEPKYKLTYFNLKGLGEPLRIMFAYAGIIYEDIRIEREDWPAIKETLPMGQMPMLEVDGQRLYQSTAIYRYIAKQIGLAGENDWENLQIDMMVETLKDLLIKVTAVKYEPDEDIKEKKLADLKENIAPFYLGKLDAIAAENNGFLALGRLTWADILLSPFSDCFNHVLECDVGEDYPNLKNVLDHLTENEGIRNWFEIRPDTIY